MHTKYSLRLSLLIIAATLTAFTLLIVSCGTVRAVTDDTHKTPFTLSNVRETTIKADASSAFSISVDVAPALPSDIVRLEDKKFEYEWDFGSLGDKVHSVKPIAYEPEENTTVMTLTAEDVKLTKMETDESEFEGVFTCSVSAWLSNNPDSIVKMPFELTVVESVKLLELDGKTVQPQEVENNSNTDFIAYIECGKANGCRWVLKELGQTDDIEGKVADGINGKHKKLTCDPFIVNATLPGGSESAVFPCKLIVATDYGEEVFDFTVTVKAASGGTS